MPFDENEKTTRQSAEDESATSADETENADSDESEDRLSDEAATMSSDVGEPIEIDTSADCQPPALLFSPGQATVAAFFGGFVGGFAIVAITLWRLKRRLSAIVVALAGPATLIGFLFVELPGLSERMQFWIGGSLAMLWTWLLAKATYGKAYREYVGNGHQPASGCAASVLGFACGILVWWGLNSLQADFYGEFLHRPRDRGVYYFSGVDRSLAVRLAKSLEDDAKTKDNPWHVQVGTDPDGRYWLALIVDPVGDAEEDKSLTWRYYVELGAEQSIKVFEGRLRSIRLCDDSFHPWKTLRIAGHETWKRHFAEADTHYNKQRFAEAEQGYRQASQTAEEFGADDHRLVLSLNNVGICCHLQGNLREAESQLRRAVLLARQGSGGKCYEIGWALDRLARVVNERGNAGEAEALFREAYEVRKFQPGEDSDDLNTSGVALAEILSDRAKYAEAETVYRELLTRIEREAKSNQPQVAAALAGLAYTQLEQDKFSEAAATWRRALSIHERLPKPDDAGIVTALAGLGAALYNQRDYAAAEEIHRRRLSLQEKLSGVGSSATFDALLELAMTCHARQSYYEAESLYLRAIAADKSSDPSRRTRFASIYLNLGAVCASQERFDDAEAHYRRSLKSYEVEVRPVFVSKTGMKALYALGDLAAYRKDYSAAETLFRSALAECERLTPVDEDAASRICVDLATACRTQKKYDEADKHYRSSVESFERNRGPSDPTTVVVRREWAANCSEAGRAQEAEKLLAKSVRVLEQTKGRDDLSVADAVTDLGVYYSGRGRIEEAESQFRRAVSIREKALGPQDPSLANAFHELAGVAEQKGDFAESAGQLAKLLAVLEKALGKDHIILAAILDRHAHLLRKTDRIDEATKAEQRAKAIRERNEQRLPEAPFGEARGVG